MIPASRLSLNQATVKPLTLTQALDLCLRHEIPAIGLWRDRVAELGLSESAAAVRRSGRHVSSLCRGGFFTHPDANGRAAALASNRAAIEEAAALEADALILVSGGLVTGSRDLGLARRMITDAIAELVPRAQELGVRLGIEPLHPMFCADRCVLVRLGDAVDLALQFPANAVGVVVDTYNVWWDSAVAADIISATARSTSGPSPARSWPPATPATPRWRSSTSKSGTPPPTKPPPPSRPASPPCSANRRGRVRNELLREVASGLVTRAQKLRRPRTRRTGPSLLPLSGGGVHRVARRAASAIN